MEPVKTGSIVGPLRVIEIERVAVEGVGLERIPGRIKQIGAGFYYDD